MKKLNSKYYPNIGDYVVWIAPWGKNSGIDDMLVLSVVTNPRISEGTFQAKFVQTLHPIDIKNLGSLPVRAIEINRKRIKDRFRTTEELVEKYFAELL